MIETSDTQSRRFAGMTVNERLFEAGLMDHFDQASRNRNRDEMIVILMQVALTEQQARETSNSILVNPAK